MKALCTFGNVCWAIWKIPPAHPNLPPLHYAVPLSCLGNHPVSIGTPRKLNMNFSNNILTRKKALYLATWDPTVLSFEHFHPDHTELGIPTDAFIHYLSQHEKIDKDQLNSRKSPVANILFPESSEEESSSSPSPTAFHSLAAVLRPDTTFFPASAHKVSRTKQKNDSYD